MGTVELFRGLIAILCVMVPAVAGYLGHKMNTKHSENQRILGMVNTNLVTLTGELAKTREEFVEFRGTVTQQMKTLEKYR